MDLAFFPASTYQRSGPIPVIETPLLGQQSQLLNIPPELRIIIYEYVFEPLEDNHYVENEDGQFESPAKYLAPLLACKLIHNEASPLAFQRANFLLPIKANQDPFISHRILVLPRSKLIHVRIITVICDTGRTTNPWKPPQPPGCAILSELVESPLNLSSLVFTARRGVAQGVVYRADHGNPGLKLFYNVVKELVGCALPFPNVQRVVVMGVCGGGLQILGWHHCGHGDKFSIVLGRSQIGVKRSRLGDWMYKVLDLDVLLPDGTSMGALEMAPAVNVDSKRGRPRG